MIISSVRSYTAKNTHTSQKAFGSSTPTLNKKSNLYFGDLQRQPNRSEINETILREVSQLDWTALFNKLQEKVKFINADESFIYNRDDDFLPGGWYYFFRLGTQEVDIPLYEFTTNPVILSLAETYYEEQDSEVKSLILKYAHRLSNPQHDEPTSAPICDVKSIPAEIFYKSLLAATLHLEKLNQSV